MNDKVLLAPSKIDKLNDPSRPHFSGIPGKPQPDSEDLQAPPPPPPKITAKDLNLSKIVFSEDRFVGDANYTQVLVECELCGGVIKMPVPKQVVLNSTLPVVPLTYVHGPPGDKHAILAHLDHDFQVRRRRFSYLVEDM